MTKALWGLAVALLCLPQVSIDRPADPLERVEPPFWWAGMHEPQLQLLLYGENLAGLKPSLSYPGVTLLGSETLGNPNYLFINLSISAQAAPGTVDIALLDGERIAASFAYSLRERGSGSAGRRGFDSRDAIYLITPDRFANGNPDNDTVPGMQEAPNRQAPGGRHGGDIAGMQRHLDYIADLGFTALWPNPLVENDQREYSYHGYSATDYYRIDPRFGTNEDFRRFVAAANAKGIGVIQDMVLNHIGDGHWWMDDLPDQNWLNGTGADEITITNHALIALADPYASETDKSQFLRGWFVDSMPDLNQRHPLVANYLIQNTIWWIEFAGLSGIRADTYTYPDPDFLQSWAERVHREYPNFNIVGEEWTRSAPLIARWQRKENGEVTGGRVKSMMDFPLHYALREGLAQDDNWNSGLTSLYQGLAHDFVYPNPQRLVIFGGNHDTSRLFSQLDDDPGLYRMAIAYLATMRGIPQFFYGDEVLMESPKHRDDGVVRGDFPGGWKGDSVNAFNGKGLSGKRKQAQDFVRSLFRWRRDNPVIHRGSLMQFAPHDNTYVYFRYDDEKIVMVAMNKGSEPATVDIDRFSEVLAGKKRARDIVSGNIYPLTRLELPARDVLVAEIY
ncbi:glycoside hydrolase family 13 protein [Microbulbifer discodermiae]|uniref:glycoside hydrolase family 13 protein n=1 Tax=Microbulbifer sp. 2201CG32-9 TaxID=3232309 RepID=UPI00345C2852